MISICDRFSFGTKNTVAVDNAEIAFQQMKQQVHERLVATLEIASASDLSAEELCEALEPFVREIVREERIELTIEQSVRLLAELPHEMFGLGPLEALLVDSEISDILVNHPHEVFVERNGTLEQTATVFADERHLMRIIQRVVSHVGRRIDESSPLVDARLDDGSRINAIIPPLALDGPKLSIRRFRKLFCSLEGLVANGTLSHDMSEFLRAAVEARRSILISGGTGSGKTTLLNALSSCIPATQRIITIEDSAELQLQHNHVARLETRPANGEDLVPYSQRDLVRNSLRMRPDRIIVGEVRGAEALDMLQAMNTGHEGSLTTIHANDTVDAVSRLEMMVAMTSLGLPSAVVRSYICSGIDLLVHLTRHSDGKRHVVRISELNRTADGYNLNDIFTFDRTGTDARGIIQGQFHVVNRPRCLQQFREHGVPFDASVFETAGVLP
jgi:pilus assembly protein CpaF